MNGTMQSAVCEERISTDGITACLAAERQALEQALAAVSRQLDDTQARTRHLETMLEAVGAGAAEPSEHDQWAKDGAIPEVHPSRPDETVVLMRLLRKQESIAAEAVREMDARCRDAYAALVEQMAVRRREADRFERRIVWLRAVLATALQVPVPRGRLMSTRPGKDVLACRLLDEGLFDADAYLKTQHDVAEAGADPLLHFVMHGLDENRLDL